MLFKQVPDTKEVERPWQEDIDRLQQTLQEVLRAVSRFSGVELAGTGTDPQGDGTANPQLDATTLKDRIRGDLEAFAATTASEMAKQAERQTRVALAAMHHEAAGQVDQVVQELRERLKGQFEPGHFELGITQQTQDRISELVQRRTDEFARWVWLMCKGTGTPIPVQIEKLLEPYVQEASDRFMQAFRQRFESQLAEQEQQAQTRIQGTLSTIEGQVGFLEEAVQKASEQSADSVKKLAAEKLESVADEAAKRFENRIRVQIDSDLDVFQTRLEHAASAMRERLRQEEDQKAATFKSRMSDQEAEIEQEKIAEISGRMQQAALVVTESSIRQLNTQANETLEHSKEELKAFLELQMDEVRQKINELGWSVHKVLSQDAEQQTERLRNLDQEIAGIRDKSVAESRAQIEAMTQEITESMKERVRQVAGAQHEEIDKLVQQFREKEASQHEERLRGITENWYNSLIERVEAQAKETGARVAAEVKANSDSVMQELSDKVDASAVLLRNETTQATSSIEEALKNSLETYQQQLVQIADSRLEEHRQAIRKSLSDLQVRLERSAQALQQEISGRFEADA